MTFRPSATYALVTYALVLVKPPTSVRGKTYAHIIKIAEAKYARQVTYRGQPALHWPNIDRLLDVTRELYAPHPVSCVVQDVHLN